uniref:Uncharacterized protein LOC114914005 n=1 Tax=Elaeis guineensis var. tenera TaxID=51953 RepID=A0A8N4EX01_ELAGV|nr:uncharacterized protein LOC114914005 [Elaeis guineensis]
MIRDLRIQRNSRPSGALLLPPGSNSSGGKSYGGALPCKATLYHRGIIPSDQANYDVCSVEEDINHILFFCPMAKQAWDLLAANLSLSQPLNPIEDVLQFLFTSHNTLHRTLVAYCGWYIWFARNFCPHNQQSINANAVIGSSLRLATEFHNTFSHDVPWDISSSSSSSIQPPILVSWLPPPHGWMKVNFDGSVRNGS